ncbi:MAG TPA: CarD family transcriptional regulator, partial [Stellaceae bacterium]|nr:CarD family transcriptional regulator [Stellaceae bacterium]
MPLDDFSSILGSLPRQATLFGAPEGHDAATLGALLRDGKAGTWLHVCRDDARMGRFAGALQFFHPSLPVLTFPAWDCLPYDRVSPNGEITSHRIGTLTSLGARLATGKPAEPIFVLTTVNAAVQRVPPRKLFEGRVLTLGVGGRIPLDRLQSFFRNNGYTRTDTVREPGEFAIRGGIVDLYPSGASQPVRLDFFGDQVESLRSFDSLTQRSTGALEKLELKPVSEVLLDEPGIHRFRTRYRELFGNVGSDDALYESVSAGRRYAGMEHWLPLYYERLETLFDYLPGAAVSFDYQNEEARAHRLESIADFYAARQSIAAAGASNAAAPLYRPVKPEQLFIGEDEWRAVLDDRSVIQLSPFAAPEGEKTTLDAGARPAKSFAAERADPKVNLFESVRDYLDVERKSGKRAAIAAYSAGSADRLGTVLRERGLTDLRRVADGGALEKLPASSVGLAILPLEQGFATDRLVILGEQDILGDRLARTPRRRRNLDEFIAEAASLSAGDLVVHEEHGIGRYEGLETIDVA